MSDDPVAFVTARLDEWAALARAAADDGGAAWIGTTESGNPWRFANGLGVYAVDENDVESAYVQVASAPFEPQQSHIAANDPTHVLREVAAMRALLDAARGVVTSQTVGGTTWLLDGIARHLAAIWPEHEDYRTEWKP